MKLLISMMSGDIKVIDIQENDIDNFNKTIYELFPISEYNLFSIVHEGLKYDKFTLELYNLLAESNDKQITIIVGPNIIKLFKQAKRNQLVEWKLLNINLEECNKNDEECDYDEDTKSSYCFLQIDGTNIDIQGTKYDFQIIFKYYYEDRLGDIDYVDCRGKKYECSSYRCRQRYCTRCMVDIDELCTEQKLIILFTEAKIISRNTQNDDSDDDSEDDSDNDSDNDSDDDSDDDIEYLFDTPYINCYLSALRIADKNIVKINYFRES